MEDNGPQKLALPNFRWKCEVLADYQPIKTRIPTRPALETSSIHIVERSWFWAPPRMRESLTLGFTLEGVSGVALFAGYHDHSQRFSYYIQHYHTLIRELIRWCKEKTGGWR